MGYCKQLLFVLSNLLVQVYTVLIISIIILYLYINIYLVISWLASKSG